MGMSIRMGLLLCHKNLSNATGAGRGEGLFLSGGMKWGIMNLSSVRQERGGRPEGGIFGDCSLDE